MIQLYATIRKESEYSNQQDHKNGKPVPFRVELDFSNPFLPVKGGIGGQYALFDVELYAVNEAKDDELVLLPMHHHVYRPQPFMAKKS